MKAVQFAADFVCAMVAYLWLFVAVFGGTAFFFQYGINHWHGPWSWVWHAGGLVALAVLLSLRASAFRMQNRRVFSQFLDKLDDETKKKDGKP